MNDGTRGAELTSRLVVVESPSALIARSRELFSQKQFEGDLALAKGILEVNRTELNRWAARAGAGRKRETEGVQGYPGELFLPHPYSSMVLQLEPPGSYKVDQQDSLTVTLEWGLVSDSKSDVKLDVNRVSREAGSEVTMSAGLIVGPGGQLLSQERVVTFDLRPNIFRSLANLQEKLGVTVLGPTDVDWKYVQVLSHREPARRDWGVYVGLTDGGVVGGNQVFLADGTVIPGAREAVMIREWAGQSVLGLVAEGIGSAFPELNGRVTLRDPAGGRHEVNYHRGSFGEG